AALAANPLGLLIVGISAAVAAFVLFADKLKITSDGLVSFGDLAGAVWSYVTDAAKIAINFISDSWNTLTNFISGNVGEWIKPIGNVFGEIVSNAKNTINGLIGVWAFGFNVISELWKAGPKGFKQVFSEIDSIASEAFSKDYLADFGETVSSGFENAT